MSEETQKKPAGGLARRKKSIILALILVAVLAVVSAVLLMTMGGEEEKKPSTILQFEKEDIAAVVVKNEFGTMDFYYPEGSKTVSMRGYEQYALYMGGYQDLTTDLKYLSNSQPVSLEKGAETYGLDKPAATVTVMLNDGSRHVVLIGNKTSINDGYYAMQEGGDKAYVVSLNVGETMLAKPAFYLDRTVSPTIPESDLINISEYRICRRGEKTIHILALSEEERKALNNMSLFRMTEPAPYYPDTGNLEHLAKGVSGIVADEVVEIGITDEKLKHYGLDNPYYELLYTYGGMTHDMKFSARDEEGRCYCYRPDGDLIYRVTMNEKFEFLNWPLINYIQKMFYMRNINDIDVMTVEAGGLKAEFHLEGVDQNLVATLDGREIDLPNFRKFYTQIIGTTFVDYSEPPADMDKAALKVTFLDRKGVETVVAYYPLSARRMFATLDGDGEFYAVKDHIQLIIDNLARIMKDEPISES